jgi:hypothetical protein
MSDWDFGRPRDDHRTQPADAREYPLGGVQWTGGHESLEDHLAADQFDGGQHTPGTLAADQLVSDEFGTDPFAGDEFSDGQFAGGRFGADLFAGDEFAGDQLAGESWLRSPGPAPTTWLPRPQPETQPEARPGRARHSGEAPPVQRWLTIVCVAVAAAALGGAAVFFVGDHAGTRATRGAAVRPSSPSSSPAPSRPAGSQTAAPSASAAPKTAKTSSTTATPPVSMPPVSMPEARAVLAAYTTGNNAANAARSDARLATVETGSSQAIDAGTYLMQQAVGAAAYPAFEPVSTTYYIPRTEPATGPRWFAARVSNAFLSSPAKVASVEYLVFTQATPGGPWLNAMEPYLLPGGSAPRIAVGGDGLTAAVAATAASLTVPPGRLPAVTAASLGGGGRIANPGNLVSGADERFWKARLPTATVTVSHAPAAGADAETFALPTAGGGALVFYADAADLTITPAAGMILHLTVPGFYSPGESLTSASLGYLDQFATYDPPAGAGAPRVIADYSGITGRI